MSRWWSVVPAVGLVALVALMAVRCSYSACENSRTMTDAGARSLTARRALPRGQPGDRVASPKRERLSPRPLRALNRLAERLKAPPISETPPTSSCPIGTEPLFDDADGSQEPLACRDAAGILRGVWAVNQPLLSKQDMDSEARGIFEAARLAFADGAFEEAAGVFRDAFRLLPYAAFLFNAGVSYEKLGDSRRAAHYFRLYLQLQPEAPGREQVQERIERLARE